MPPAELAVGRLEEEETQLPPVPGTVAELLVVMVVAAVTAVRGKKRWWWAYECAKGDASPSVDRRIVSMSGSVLSLV